MILSNHIKILFYGCIILSGIACKEKYGPPFIPPKQGYLVVEGFINSNGPTNIRLSRSIALATAAPINESNAIVRVEGQNNITYPLTHKGNGLYSADFLSLNANEKYRLYIRTAAGREYLSDFTQARKTPPIDSIAWEQAGGVQLYINTHDPQNNTRYYKWEYDETWVWHPTHRSYYRYTKNGVGLITGLEDRPLAEIEAMYTCWSSETSHAILAGTSAHLSRDSIHLPLGYVPFKSVKISILYSINVKQIAISEQEYTFLQTMKKNTEQLGSIFDPLPSQVTGNIRCKTDAKEIVIGFISVADAQEKRIFISNSQLTGWNYYKDCPETGVDFTVEEMRRYAAFIPTLIREYTPAGDIDSINVAGPDCVDCRLNGTNIKPSFWP